MLLPVVPIVTSALLPSRGWVRGSVRKNFVPPFIKKMAGMVPGKPSNYTSKAGLSSSLLGPVPNFLIPNRNENH